MPRSKSLITLLVTLVGAAIAAAGFAPALAYVPQSFNPAIDTGQDFTKVPQGTPPLGIGGINQHVWTRIFWYGGSNNPGPQFYFSGSSGLWITSTAAANWPSTGMMQNASGCSVGFGYGNFHWRSAEAASNDGPGANEVMWPADNDPGWPGIIKGSSDPTISEVDASEVNFGSNGQGYATFHYFNAAASYNNGQIIKNPITFLAGAMTSMHDYDVVWGPGSLVLYIDGVVQMSAPPTQVRADYAHGGCNYTLGAQMAMQSTAYDKSPLDRIEIANMWWSATNGSAGGSPPPSPNQTKSITVSAPGTIAQTTAGAGATVTMTVTLSNVVGSIFEEVVTAKGQVEPGAQTIPTGANPTILFAVHFQQTGDYLVVADHVPNPTVAAASKPVTITGP